MIKFNIKNIINSFRSSKKEEAQKTTPIEKPTEASSSEALNSYGRAFVHLNTKADIQEQTKNSTDQLRKSKISLAKSLFKNKYKPKEIKNILFLINSSDKEINLKQAELAIGLTKDRKINFKEIKDILSYTKTDDKELTLKQLDLVKNLLNCKNFNLHDIVDILPTITINNTTNPVQKENHIKQIEFVQELADSEKFRPKEIKNIIINTKTNNVETNANQLAFAKKLVFDKNLDFKSIVGILYNTSSENKKINLNQIEFVDKLIENKKYKTEDIKDILSATNSTQEDINSSQIELFSRLDKKGNFDIKDIISILFGTKTNEIEINRAQNEFLNELLNNKKINNKNIGDILIATNSTDEEVNTNQIAFFNELFKKCYKDEDISGILYYTNSNNKNVNTQQISFVKNLIKNSNFDNQDISNILKTIRFSNMSLFLSEENFNTEDIALKQIALATELTKNNRFSTDEINKIFSDTISVDKDINLRQLDLAIELVKNTDFDTKEIKDILHSTTAKSKNITLNQITFAINLIKNNDFTSKETKDLLLTTRADDDDINSAKIFLVNNLIGKNRFDTEDIKNIVFSATSDNKKINSNQISLVLELLKNEKFNGEDIALISYATKSDNEKINSSQVEFARELIENKNFNGDNIWNILYYGTKSDNEKINFNQITFARNYLIYNSKFNNKDIGLVLASINSDNIKTNINQMQLANELIRNSKFNSKDISFILYGTNSNNDEINSMQIELTRKLAKDERFNRENVKKALLLTKSPNIFVILNQIDFANELIKRGKFSANDICNILKGTNSKNQEINQLQMEFFDKLDKSGKFNQEFSYKFNGEDIGDILVGLNSDDLEDYKSRVKDATVFLREIDEENRRIAKVQAIGMIMGRDSITFPDIIKLQYCLGYDNVIKLKNQDIVVACKLIGLYKANDINEIPLEEKKNIIRGLIQCNDGCFKVSSQLKKFYPLVPTTQEEYCSLLPKLVKSLGIETQELTEEEINKFNSAIFDLANNISTIPDEDFSKIKIQQEYPKSEFIKDVLNIIGNLPTDEQQKVYDYFGFELNKIDKRKKSNENPENNYTITGYPININNGKKLAKIKNQKTKETIEKLRPLVIKYSENNKISIDGIFQKENIEHTLNTIVKYLPEFQPAIGKIQHRTHKYDISLHSLKVMQKIVQNPEFNKLDTSDKKLLLLASLLHDLSKAEAKTDPFHADNSSLDAFYISKKFNLTRDEELKLYSLIKNHEWLAYVNNSELSEEERLKKQQSVAFDLQYDNLFDMSKMFTVADLKAVKTDDEFYNRFKDAFIYNSDKIDNLIKELKTTQPLLPVTKFPTASRINEAITFVNPDGTTNLKGIYKTKEGLVVIRFNEVENSTWEKIGFNKGTISKGITIESPTNEKINTGNIHFFVHGLEYENQLSKFDAFSLPDSDALLSVTYSERPESKTRFYRTQGVIVDAETKYIYGGGESNAGSGCKKSINNFKKNYIFDGKRNKDRIFISQLIKETLGLNNEEYLDFVQKNKNKAFDEIEEKEAIALIKAFSCIDSNNRVGNREYNEMYLSNPKIMAVFAYPQNPNNIIGDTMEFVDSQSDFLKKYAINHDNPMVVFGD